MRVRGQRETTHYKMQNKHKGGSFHFSNKLTAVIKAVDSTSIICLLVCFTEQSFLFVKYAYAEDIDIWAPGARTQVQMFFNPQLQNSRNIDGV